MDDKVLVVKLNSYKTTEQLFDIYKGLKSQISTGVVVLPFGCEALIVPKDIEIGVESIPKVFNKNCNTCNNYIQEWKEECSCSMGISGMELDDIIKGKKECPSYIEEAK